MNQFIESIEKIRTSKDRNFFADLHSFFQSINSMNRDETIAAYQALQFFWFKVLSKEECDKHFELLEEIDDAIIARMIAIISDTPREQRFEITDLFWIVTDACPTLRSTVKRVKELHERINR